MSGWTPNSGRVVVGAVRDALIELTPEAEADLHRERAGLRRPARCARTPIPRGAGLVDPAARVLVTAHDAFAYFGAAYGFEVTGIQGISTESEAGLARIAELVDMLVERRIGAVFVESTVSDRNVRALVEGAAARGHEVSSGASSIPTRWARRAPTKGTYIGMIDHNVTTIASALGGEAPERGMNGRLAAGS